MPGAALLDAHLQSGCTTVARVWSVSLKDGVVLGFTDHDQDLTFDGVIYRADTGLSARALQQSTGLSVDNTEALGALSAAAICEADISAGRYDGAEVLSWLVNWSDVAARKLVFRGHIGEMRRHGGAFHAELRGLTDVLNRPMGRVIQKSCPAVLGDSACGIDLSAPGMSTLASVHEVASSNRFVLSGVEGLDEGWFRRGRFHVLTGEGAGLSHAIQDDRQNGALRVIDLWETLRVDIQPGDQIRLIAGCDGTMTQCQCRFGNLLNFRGFPDVPTEDWLTAMPAQTAQRSGGSRR